MKRWEAILAAAMAISLAGCVLSGKPKAAKNLPATPQPAATAAAPPPPPKLSIPQTQVELPAEQPLNPEALNVPPPATPVETPPAPRGPRRPTGPVARTEPAPQPAPPQPTVEERPKIQEILPAAEQKRLQDAAEEHKRQIRQLIAQVRNRRRLTGEELNLVKRINQFITLSDEDRKAGDMRGAEDLAQRALVLAQGLQRER